MAGRARHPPPRRSHPLSEEQRADNRLMAAVRAGIEKIFGHWQRVLGRRRMRYVGLLKSTLELQLKSVAWNLRRLVNLCAAGKPAARSPRVPWPGKRQPPPRPAGLHPGRALRPPPTLSRRV